MSASRRRTSVSGDQDKHLAVIALWDASQDTPLRGYAYIWSLPWVSLNRLSWVDTLGQCVDQCISVL